MNVFLQLGRFKNSILLAPILSMALASCVDNIPSAQSPPEVLQTERVAYKQPKWVKNAVLYEINPRNFTEEGTFNAIADHVDRLDKLGVSAVVITPFYQTGKLSSLGGLSNPHQIADHKSVSKEYGDIEDFKTLVKKFHRAGIKVLIEWITGYTSSDHKWVQSNPNWFIGDTGGIRVSRVESFDADLAQLNTQDELVHFAMQEAMKFWVSATDIDGFYCLDSREVPITFWTVACDELRQAKPLVFVSADSWLGSYKAGFDMHLDKDLYPLMLSVARQDTTYEVLDPYFKNLAKRGGQIPVYYTSSNLLNALNGSSAERFGKHRKAMNTLAVIAGNTYLVLGGQEVGLDKQMPLTRKNNIDWAESSYSAHYSRLLKQKRSNTVLNSNPSDAKHQRITTSRNLAIHVFKRELEGNDLLSISNHSKWIQTFSFIDSVNFDGYYNVLKDEPFKMDSARIRFMPGETMLLSKIR